MTAILRPALIEIYFIVWIASNGAHIPRNSTQFRELSKSRIRLVVKALDLT